MTKFYTIYKITNKVNYKTYIGKHITENLLDGYMGSGISLKEDKKKYGIKNFKKEILFCFDNELDMIKKEVELISENAESDNTYNLVSNSAGIKNKSISYENDIKLKNLISSFTIFFTIFNALFSRTEKD